MTGGDHTLGLNPAPNFEFGKRKRWADLVMTSLVDVLILVLSPQAKILYCGNGLKNLLDWTDTEVIDHNFRELIHEEDRSKFISAFEESLQSGDPLLSLYLRLKSGSAQSSAQDLFELVGRPQIVEDAPDDDDDAAGAGGAIQVMFLVAKPYPSKSLETLNTYIDLQEEHTRLQQRVAELRARAPRSAPSSPPPPPSPPRDRCAYSAAEHTEDEDGEPARKKKMTKKSAPAPPEQYACITCGRTDSPEWRKGPTGPKTLCNACGLRWAKQVKTQKMADEAAAAASGM
ncbi:hypothetical protein MKEN_01035900 [Mycena kentingensis (nom. inval.)]|nr:hypothetical protein MKEN_01035900 [Mycena kentingensis (nom. inval.)]